MLRILILLMIIIPALEIWGLVKAADIIGGWQTVAAVIATGVIGAYLAKLEGLKTWIQAQHDLSQGRVPGKAIFDGISIFAGGLLLLTPGFFTDTIGFLLIFPYTRNIFQYYIKKWLEKKIRNGEIHFYVHK